VLLERPRDRVALAQNALDIGYCKSILEFFYRRQAHAALKEAA
jgi:hypothetical protein